MNENKNDVFANDANENEIIKQKLRRHFDGKIVRKDLTKKNQRRCECSCLCS